MAIIANKNIYLLLICLKPFKTMKLMGKKALKAFIKLQ